MRGGVLLGGTVAGAMFAAVVWASFAGGGWSVLGDMMREPLYLATLVDLYAAAALILAWIWIRHRSVAVTVGMGVILLLTGSIGAGLYVAIAAARARGDLHALMLGRSGTHPAA